MRHPSALPSLVFADSRGNICDYEPLAMAGMSAGKVVRPEPEDLIPLPEGSELFLLPERAPIGLDPGSGEPFVVEDNPYGREKGIQAVAAFMAPAHTATHTSAFQTKGKSPKTLPLFAYAAVGWRDGRFWVAGFRSDPDNRQDTDRFDHRLIERRTRQKLKQHQNNRLVQHLGKCCLTYCCPAARNYFLGRWEAPLPTSPHCNARCAGCISLQPSGCCPSTQERIDFVPHPGELTEIAVAHLNAADRAIVSFGQGCEGEPLLQADTIAAAISRIRQATDRGTINLNSNASLPDRVATLARTGLDSLRVSLNSAQERYYTAYYRPQGYRFADVLLSIAAMKEAGRFVSLNYFVFPGLTDSVAEFEALCQLIEKHSPDLLQLRNLNMDPEWYLRCLDFRQAGPAMGIRAWKEQLAERFPQLRFGYFNPPLDS